MCHSEPFAPLEDKLREESQPHEETETSFSDQILRFTQYDNKKSVKLSI